MKVNLKSYRDSSGVNNYCPKNDNKMTFQGFYNNKMLKQGLEFAAKNGALFAASTTLTLSATMRPAVILLTPKSDKENKKIACAKSIASSGVGFLMTFVFSLPLMLAIRKIDKNPQKFLNSDSIKTYDKKSYEFATQLFKLGLGTAIAIPKAILTAAGLPYIMQSVFSNKDKNVSFRGKDRLANGVGKILNNKDFQKFTAKNKNSNFPMHIFAMTDTLTTLTFIRQILKSKKVEENRKKPLAYNAGISTALSIGCGYILDNLTDKPTEKFIENFKNANKGQPNLEKQIEGIKIAKPILLLATVYYTLIPLISTFLADRTQKNKS